jgi:hypothetical protein
VPTDESTKVYPKNQYSNKGEYMTKRYILKQNVEFKSPVVGGYNYITFTLTAKNMAEAHAKAMATYKTDDIVIIPFDLSNIMAKDERYLNPNL